jgi:hypothetical protein
MASESNPAKVASGRTPDNRFCREIRASEKRSILKRIDITALQLDDTFDGDGDPYNNTGRHLLPLFKDK